MSSIRNFGSGGGVGGQGVWAGWVGGWMGGWGFPNTGSALRKDKTVMVFVGITGLLKEI